MEDMLEKMEIPSEVRRSVLKSDTDSKKGFVLGWVRTFRGTRAVSGMTRKHPALMRAVSEYARQHFPRHYWEACQVNLGASGLHTDSYNCGPSYIVGFGKYEGGELWEYPGRVVSIKRPQRVDGSKPHITLPYKGRRWSLVYFAGRVELPPPAAADVTLMRSLGLPALRRPTHCQEIRNDLLPDAAEKLRKLGLTRGFIGDFANKTIASRYAH